MQHEHHRVPVTALAFFGSDIILAGEGNYLRAYSTNAQLLASERIFESQAIHGIILDHAQSTAFVYGGALFTVLDVNHGRDRQISISFNIVHDVGDWILDAAFPPTVGQASHRVSILTAHNALYLANFDSGQTPNSGSRRSAHIECLISRSNSILYSAHTAWLSPCQCLIVSGTAFGDIIVWSAFISNNSSTRTQTHYTFSAHEGSIFGVQISPLVTLPGSDKKTRVFASCSDDRNIKLWDISNLTTESPTLAEMQRDTGFGASERRLDVAPPCLANVMGHVSRIWQVRFVIEPSSELRKVQSLGEDASMITWRLNPGTTHADFDLEKLDVTVAHSGKNIWAVVEDSAGRLATGGADGAIATYSDASDVEHLIELSDKRINGSEMRDNLKAYGFIDTQTLVSTTDHGSILQIDLDECTGERITTIADPIKSLRGFSIAAAVPGLAFMAGANGSIYCYVKGSIDIQHIVSGDGKPAGLFARQHSEHETALLITTVGSSTGRLLLMEVDCGSWQVQITRQIVLSLPTNFIVTSFSTISTCSEEHVVLGSRTGSLAVYKLREDHQSEPISASVVCTFVHDKEAITHLHTTVDGTSEQSYWLMSTGRDGTFAVHRLRNRDESLELSLVHQLSLPFGPNIEGMSLSAKGTLLAWGFKSKDFIVYDLVTQREIMSVECGGAHRNWAFQPHDAGGMFIWTKASKVYRKTQSQLPFELLNSGGHGREVKSVAVSSSEPQIIATGAEDTDIKLHRLEDGKFKCIQTLRKHNTGIQCLQWSGDGRYLFSSGGFEEFFVWRVNFGIPCLQVGVVCESKHPRSGTSDLRIMGFDVYDNSEDVAELYCRHFTIIMAYSDSTTNLWSYQADKWELLASGDYLTACLTHAIWADRSDFQFITTATDGHLAMWRTDTVGQQLMWSDRHKVHQSAIHTATTRKLSDGSTLLISGGDDNGIGITRMNSGSKQSNAKTMLIARAHAAAVTGLVCVALNGSTYWLISAGIDQRLKLWRIEIDLSKAGVDGVEVKLRRNFYTAVADVSSLDLVRLDHGNMGVVVSGVGMDVWRLPSTLEQQAVE